MHAKSSLIVILTVGCTLPAPVIAQRSDTAADIDQIVVTAARSPVALNRLGSATTVISRKQIDRRQSRYVTDLLRSVPGFSVAQTGVIGSQTQVRVRGAEANHVLVMIDGVRANDPGTGDEFRWEYLSTANIERIEIVRGPQSSLWGSAAVAAVVNIITRTASDDTHGDLFAEGGSNSSTNFGANGGFANGSWRFGGGVEMLDTDGRNISRSGNERDGADLTTASINATFDASDSLAFDAVGRYVDAYSQFDPVDFATTGLPTDADRAAETEQASLRLGARMNSGSGRFTHQLQAHWFDAQNVNLADGEKSSSSKSTRQRFFYQLDLRLGEQLLSTALEHERTEFEQRGEVSFGDPNQDQSIDVTSFIVDLQGLAGNVSWLLSARLDENSDFENAVTGRVALAYALGDATTLRATAGTAQKNPTFTERFGFFPGQFIGNPALEPERSRSLEFGVDQRLLDGRLSLQATVFQAYLDDEINGFVFDPNTFLSTAENRSGESERSGVELAATWQLNENFELSGSYTYTDSRVEDDAQTVSRELRRPRHMGHVGASYRFADDRAGLTIAADYAGASLDQFFPPFPAAAEVVALDNFWLVDLNASFRVSDRTSVYARATNLLDEEFEQVIGYRTLGRAVYAGIKMSFGGTPR